MARLLPCLYALATTIAPVAYAQTIFQRAAATITSMGPVVTDTAAFEGYTSFADMSSYSAMYCDPGSTWKSFGGVSSLAACCPTAGNCNPPYQCNALQLDLYNGDATHCVTATCGTGNIYDKPGDASASLYMYGCWDDFVVYRTIDKSASASIAATAAAASTTGSSPSSSGAKSASTGKSGGGGGAHPGIVAAAVAVSVVVILIIAGLVAYIVRLRGAGRAPPPPTELQKVGGGPSAPGSAWDVAGGAGKPELSGGAGANAWEMGGREIPHMPGGVNPAAVRPGEYNPASGSIKYPGDGSPAPSGAPRTPDGQYAFVEAPARPYSFLEMEGSSGPRWGAELPG